MPPHRSRARPIPCIVFEDTRFFCGASCAMRAFQPLPRRMPLFCWCCCCCVLCHGTGVGHERGQGEHQASFLGEGQNGEYLFVAVVWKRSSFFVKNAKQLCLLFGNSLFFVVRLSCLCMRKKHRQKLEILFFIIPLFFLENVVFVAKREPVVLFCVASDYLKSIPPFALRLCALLSPVPPSVEPPSKY